MSPQKGLWKSVVAIAAAMIVSGTSGCAKSQGNGESTALDSGAGPDADTDVDTDADLDTDSETDGDTESDSDSDTDTSGSCEPGSEPEFSWCDGETGLLWEDPPPDSPSGIGWELAEMHCDILAIGDYDGWRLPTISELRTLVRDCPSTEVDGACGVEMGCLELACEGAECSGCPLLEGPDDLGCYWETTLEGICEPQVYWSSSQVADAPAERWVIHFGTGAIQREADEYADTDTDLPPEANVRCVLSEM